MKKLLFLLMILIVTTVSAQEKSDSSIAVKVDSLQLELSNLKHEFNYFYCSSELNRLANELNIKANDIHIMAMEIEINVYDNNYLDEIYRKYKRNYDAYINNFEQYKEYLVSNVHGISITIEQSNFPDFRLKMLKSCINVIESKVELVQSKLDYYKGMMELYKSLE